MNCNNKIIELSASELSEVAGGLTDTQERLLIASTAIAPLITVPLALGIWVGSKC